MRSKPPGLPMNAKRPEPLVRKKEATMCRRTPLLVWWSSCSSKNRAEVRKTNSRLHALERRGMFRHLLAVHEGLATRRDGVRVVEGQRQ